MGVRTVAEIREKGYDRPGDPPRWIQSILIRTWFLLVPMVAISWYQSRKIGPMILDWTETIRKRQVEAESARKDVLSRVNATERQLSMLRALADTFEVRFEQVELVLDSVRTLQNADRAERASLEGQIDSLRGVYSRSEGEKAQKSKRLAELQARVDSLRNTIETRDHNAESLAAEVALKKAQMDRVLNPDAYRDKDALMNGPGDFPDRDARFEAKTKKQQ